MGSDDFIDLEPCSDSDNKGEASVHNLDSRLSESEYAISASKKKEDIPNGDNYEAEERKKDIGNELKAIVGIKRARMTSVDQPPTVRVIYSSLTRESKRRLMELMQQWSEWHAHSQSSSNESLKESLEYGEETYFPALNVGSENNSTVSFWLDSKSRVEEVREYQVDNDAVPLYDRGCTLGSTLPDGSTGPERSETLEASRCFNCGSYNHSLKECPKPRDNVAINNARQQLNSKRNQAPGSRAPSRYYQKSPGKFDDLKAGVLGLETRESLGIGELDPPPWLQRMRDMGYPPGYLDVVEDEDQPSGITIFGDEEKVEHEDGELPEKGEPEPQEKKMTVEFPGINAPVPKNADQRRWAVTPCAQSGSNSSSNRSNPRSKPPSLDSPRMSYHDQRRSVDHRNEGPPGADYGPAASIAGYSPRYSPYDISPISGSPRLGRSLSDRGWRSPLPYATSPGLSPHSPYPYARSPGLSPHSPYPYSSLQRESQYHGPTAGPEQWRHESPYSASPDMSSQQPRDWYDHRLQRR